MTFRAEAGKRAWYVDRNCDVLRVFEKSKTTTVQFWGSGLSEGKLVTMRGVHLDRLSAPRKLIPGVYAADTGRPIYEEPAAHE